MSQEICTFKYCKTTNGFETNSFTGSELVFIEQTGQIWTHGNYFGADLSKLVTKDNLSTLLSSYVTEDILNQQITDRLVDYQPKGEYVVTDDLANYYNKQEIENKLSNKANSEHDHTTADITDLSTYISNLGFKKIEIVNTIPDKPDISTIYLVV